MLAVLLLLLVAGIALTQTVSDPHQVTLAWLRLGGLIALGLLAVLAVWLAQSRADLTIAHLPIAVCGVAVGVQSVLVGSARRRAQRVAAGIAAVAALVSAAWLLPHPSAARTAQPVAAVVATVLPAAALTGGTLMTMLLGHAYLTAGSAMTQRPFRRLVALLAVALALRTIAGIAFGVVPFVTAPADPGPSVWLLTMIVARYAAGVVTPALLLYMTWDCVRRRSNQSATGILYVATLLLLLGEGMALGLLDPRGWVF